MSVKIHIHPYLIHLAENKDIHEVDGKTVGECLEKLVERYPELDEWLFTKDRDLNNMFDVFVNMQSTLSERLETKVTNGDDINLVVVIAGG
ncbi:MoaD/ThiS family protein [Chloroflexota bacterium]